MTEQCLWRVGTGFDVHAFASGRLLILGGVRIDYPKGLAGHSDADVVCHAVIDALLGAAGLGDIGRHFPDTDPQWEGANSLELLKQVSDMLAKHGWKTGNVDVTIIAQVPRMAPHIQEMCKRMAGALGVEAGSVNVKATTTERLGFTGRAEGIAAQAAALIRKEE